jgi:hypothetical protein
MKKLFFESNSYTRIIFCERTNERANERTMRVVIRSPERWVQVTDARTAIGPSRRSHGQPHAIPRISKAARHRSPPFAPRQFVGLRSQNDAHAQVAIPGRMRRPAVGAVGSFDEVVNK